MPLKLIAEFTQADDLQCLRGRVADFVAQRGFRAGFFLAPIARNNIQGRILTSGGFPESWVRAYRRALHKIDPLPEIALSLGCPFRWGQASLLRPLSANQRRYITILQRIGMSDGIAYPLFGNGARAGLAGLGHHSDLDGISAEVRLEIQIMLQAAYQTYCRLTADAFTPEAELSGRERDVLFWLTQGKSNNAIATILAISPATVDTYMRRIFLKLDVSDRVGAAMAAVQHGYVIAGDYHRVPLD